MAISKKTLVLGVVGGFVGLLILGSLIDDDTGSAPPNPALMQDASNVSANVSMEPVTFSDGAVKCAIRNAFFVYKAFREPSRLSDTFKEYVDDAAAFSQKPKVAFNVQIPPDQFIYWSDFGELSEGTSCPEAGEVLDHPFDAVDIAVRGVIEEAKKFEDTPKGEFESSDEYAARIASEKAAFDANHAGLSYSTLALSEAWHGIVGGPRLHYHRMDGADITYDVDRAVLKFKLASNARTPFREGIPQAFAIDVPVEVALSRDAAKLYSEALRGEFTTDGLTVAAVAMQFHDGTLSIREISIVPTPGEYQSDPGIVQAKAMQAAGFSLEHVPMNYEFPFRFNN